jgi:O-antigen ligase
MACLADRRLALGVLAVSVLGMVPVLLRGLAWAEALLFSEEVSEVVGTLSLQFRRHVWQAAIWSVRDYFFTGMGMGCFRRLAPTLYVLPLPATLDIAHAHNGFLQAGVDLGILGIVGYAGVYLAAARMILSTLRLVPLLRTECPGPEFRALAIGLGGCLAASFIFNWLDTVALGAKPTPMWWMLVGMTAALSSLVSAQATEGGAALR